MTSYEWGLIARIGLDDWICRVNKPSKQAMIPALAAQMNDPITHLTCLSVCADRCHRHVYPAFGINTVEYVHVVDIAVTCGTAS